MLSGSLSLMRGMAVIPDSGGGRHTSLVSVVLGAVTGLIGLGLLLRVEAVRGIVNVFCFVDIALSLLSLAGSLLGSLVVGPIAILFMLSAIFDICTAGFMIFLIGETESGPPPN